MSTFDPERSVAGRATRAATSPPAWPGAVPPPASQAPAASGAAGDARAAGHARVAADAAAPDAAPGARVIVLGTDALLAALPATPVQVIHACLTAGWDAAIPASWGDELVATACLRELAAREAGPAIQCSCPCVARRLTMHGPELDGFLVPIDPPPVAAARYVRAAYQPATVDVTYAGACPAGLDPAIDRALAPAALLAALAERGVSLGDQPTAFEAMLPPDRRRHRSLPGGVPAPEALLELGDGRRLVELHGDDFAAELAEHLLAGERVLLDLAPPLGCVCSGSIPTLGPERARAVVSALEPPRAARPVVEAPGVALRSTPHGVAAVLAGAPHDAHAGATPPGASPGASPASRSPCRARAVGDGWGRTRTPAAGQASGASPDMSSGGAVGDAPAPPTIDDVPDASRPAPAATPTPTPTRDAARPPARPDAGGARRADAEPAPWRRARRRGRGTPRTYALTRAVSGSHRAVAAPAPAPAPAPATRGDSAAAPGRAAGSATAAPRAAATLDAPEAPEAPDAPQAPDAPDAEFERFLGELRATIAERMADWRLRLRGEVARWQGEGVATRVLERALALDEPPDLDGLLRTFGAAVHHLRALEEEALLLAPDLASELRGHPVFRDPERIEHARRVVDRLARQRDVPASPVPTDVAPEPAFVHEWRALDELVIEDPGFPAGAGSPLP